MNYCLVTDLIIWTQYEIQVAAYNGAGLGVFSRAVTEYTLQGGKLVSKTTRWWDLCQGMGFARFDWSMLERKTEFGPLGGVHKEIHHVFNGISPAIPQ